MGDHRSSLRPLPATSAHVELQLLDAFRLRVGEGPVELPGTAQRLVAFLALHDRPVLRGYVAGTIWPETPEERAAANLRSSLWRVQKRAPGLLHVDPGTLELDATVEVDLREAETAARRALADDPIDARSLAGDLLPGWYDDWVLLERERFRQLRLQALDAASETHLRAGDLGRALDAALLSVAGEPLRESAHRAVVRVHLVAGNASEALRQYELCRMLLQSRLGLEPTQLMHDALGDLDGVETNR